MTAIKLKHPWQLYNAGAVIPEAPAAMAETLVKRGIAEYVTDKAAPSAIREIMSLGKRANYVTKTP